MAQARFDSEAMLHQMPAKPITSASRFVSVLDKDHHPLVLCAGNDGKFYALQATASGTFVAVDLCAKLGISGGVQAIAATQNATTGKLYLAVATKPTASSNASSLTVLAPIAPSFVDVTDQDLRRSILFNNTPPQNVQVVDLYVNASVGTDNTWPLLVSVFRAATGGATDDAKVSRINVLPTRWEWSLDLGLPQTVKNILDITPLRTPAGQGIACLYQYNRVKSIIFTTTDPGDKWVTQVDLPAGADPLSLAAVLDSEDYSGLLISGGGLYRLDPYDVVQSGTVATRLSSDTMYNTASRLTVAQTGLDFSLWFRTSDNTLGYQRGRPELLGAPIPLLPAGTSADFAPLLDPESKSQALVVLGETNDLTLMSQSADTSMWKAVPLLIQDLGQVMDVKAFVTHIEIKDADGLPIANEVFSLKSSGWTRALINGHERVLDQRPASVSTNERGVITVVVPTQDISSYSYTLDNLTETSQSHRLANSYTIDPSGKVQERIGVALAGKNLRDIDTPEGKLLDGSKASDADIQAAQDALKNMAGVLKDTQGKSATSASSTGSAASARTALASSTTEPKQKGWGWWEWVKSKISAIGTWFVQKLKDAWHFVVQIAGEVWAFILDTATAVVKAVTWILQKVGAAFKKIWAWVSFIFNIQDIKDVANSLRTMFNASLAYAQTFILDKRNAVDAWADGLEAKVISALNVQLPPELANKKQSPKDVANSSDADRSDKVSAPSNVALYQLDQGKNVSAATQAVTNPILTLYADFIKPILEELGRDVKVLGDLIFKLFSGSKKLSTQEIMSQIAGTLIHTLAQSLKNLVTGLMKFGADLIGTLTTLINTPFSEFPVIGPLLKALGFNASILDIVVYVLAVPVTVFAKLISGRAPRRILAFDYKALAEKGPMDKNVLNAYGELGSYLGITEAFVESLIRTFKIATAEVPEPETFSAIGLTFSLIISAISFPYDRDAPAWEYRLSIWSANLVNILVHAACVKAKASPKVTAAIDAAVAVLAFSLAQVVHHEQIGSSASVWKGRDDALIGFSVGASVFKLVEAVSGTVGIVASDPFVKLGATIVVAGCGASRAVIKTGTSVREQEMKLYDQ